ncbi:CCAAT/enhancer-binding protein zeta [Anoplophora glabripennis]|uniref:CCAAT/enhancer-binding protein zeta n=1 Tax=Anoplophora glabripennis TaxID=217634 RepID=UPI000874670B|nr:CCAAT/enhancer-binding protein zeta [Anoplophora glabripennis]
MINKLKFNNKKNFKSPRISNEDILEEYEEPKKWFDEIQQDEKNFSKSSEQELIQLKDEAKKCHDSEVANYNIKNSKTNANYQWMKTVMAKGTISDKIAAHTVSIQDNPLCNLETIRNLVGMVKVGKKKECTTVIEILTELFLSDLLRPDQKLRAFHQRPLSKLNEMSSGNAVTRRKLLSLWYFEDQLKELYASYVLALNSAAHDSVENNKEKAITAMYKLLAGNPEQEKNLLSYVVNKLGDPSQKVASKVIYCLTQLLFKHTNMQGVVLNEIEKLMFRPNISSRAQYYSLCFLSQFYLSHEASDVARKLIEVYFSFFKACIKKGDVDSRMMSALLMGLNRAYPYAKIEFEKISEHIDTMYRLVHLANFNISLHTLTLLYQVSDFGNNITDRFYSALYRKLADPRLLSTTHQAMLLNLIYKTLLKDTELNRVKMFIKRLLQISLFTQPCFSCGLLYLVSQIITKKKSVQALVLKATSIDGLEDDDDEERYCDVKDETTVGVDEVEEIKQEDEDVEIKEEDVNDKEGKSEIVVDPNAIEIKEEEEDVKPDKELLDASLTATGSWYHCRNTIKKEKSRSAITYRPLSRNPLYGGGEFCAYTELYRLKDHFHPTVKLYATNIINGESIKYSGDPIKDFTLIRFLDRFVFKNPKKIDEKPGSHPTFGIRKLYKPKGVKMLSVNSAGYLKESQQNIPVDELFMYSYLQNKYREKEPNEEDSDLESVQSDEFEEMLDKMSGIKDVDEDIDYMDEIGDTLKSDKTKGKDKEDQDEEDLSDDGDMEEGFDDLEDDDDELSDMDDDDKDLIGDLEDDDEEDIDFIEDDNKPNKGKKNKYKDKDNVMSLFASAEEFATLLDDEGSSKIKPGSSNVYANKDNANVKQLAWEDKRNRWLKGFNKAVGASGGKKFDGNKNIGKKRPNQNKSANKKKKMKKIK